MHICNKFKNHRVLEAPPQTPFSDILLFPWPQSR